MTHNFSGGSTPEPYQVGTHQLNFCKSADEISASLKTLMEKYEKEVQAIVDDEDCKVRWGYCLGLGKVTGGDCRPKRVHMSAVEPIFTWGCLNI